MILLATLLPLIFIPIIIAIIDFIIVFRAKYVKPHRHHDETKHHSDFSILIPIFGNVSYLKNVDFLKKYRNKVILCTTTKETKEFNDNINLIAKKNGFKIFRSEVPLASTKHKPNPWRLFTNTLTQEVNEINKDIVRDEIMRDSFTAINTEYCIFIDGDTIAEDNIEKLVGLMMEKDYDLASVRVLASKTETIMEKLQSVEYELAMDARRVYPWLTSGAAMIAKSDVIREIMKHHSLYFQGGDIEIGKLAVMMGYRVGHLSFIFYTDVPSTFQAWWRQRKSWFGGGFRHAVINLHRHQWRYPLFFFYNTLLVFFAFPLRWYEVIKHPIILIYVIFLYWFLIYIFHWKKKKWWYLLFPMYSLIQVMILVPIGVVTYFIMAHHSENAGLIKLRHTRIEENLF